LAHPHAGNKVVVKEPAEGGLIWIYHQETTLAEHRLAAGRG